MSRKEILGILACLILVALIAFGFPDATQQCAILKADPGQWTGLSPQRRAECDELLKHR